MISRKLLVISLAFAGFAAPGLSSASWFHDPEAGVPGVDAISELRRGPSPTHEQIVADIASFKKNPVSADGLYHYDGGDQSWDFIGTVYEWQDGQFVRTALRRGVSPTHEQIVADIASFKKNPISADGLYHYDGGDQSWDFIGAVYEWRDGQFIRTDRS